MKVRFLAKNWPLQVAGIGARRKSVALSDQVLSAQRLDIPTRRIALDVRKPSGGQYRAVLDVPEHLVNRAFVAITQAQAITLGDIGELDI